MTIIFNMRNAVYGDHKEATEHLRSHIRKLMQDGSSLKYNLLNHTNDDEMLEAHIDIKEHLVEFILFGKHMLKPIESFVKSYENLTGTHIEVMYVVERIAWESLDTIIDQYC